MMMRYYKFTMKWKLSVNKSGQNLQLKELLVLVFKAHLDR